MKKTTEKTTIHHYLKGFLQHGFYVGAMVVSALILVAVYLMNFNVDDYHVFPNHRNFHIDFYNDSIDNGHSIIHQAEVTDSAITVNFVLKEGFVRPYIGITFIPEGMHPFDLSAYNELQLETWGENSGNMVVYLVTQSGRKQVGGRFPDGYFGSSINIPAKAGLTSIAFSQLKTPDWWFDVNNFSPNESVVPDWRHTTQMNITTGLTPALDVPRLVHFRSIRFSRNNTMVVMVMCAIELFIVCGLMLFHWVKLRRKNRTDVITIAYKPVELSETKTANSHFFDYIHAHFDDSELSLETVSTACKVSPRRIAGTIMDMYGCNFKTYINQIRITEAKRLMLESDLNISEIAYKVGFNSPNHFNRVFKALTGNNPSGFIHQAD